MKTREIIGLNTKWYRYQNNMSVGDLSAKTGLKNSYIKDIEKGIVNLTCNTIDIIVNAFKIKNEALVDERTALKAKKLPDNKF